MTFALTPAWPPGFRSRTAEPGDPCFIGRIGNDAKKAHPPGVASLPGWAGEAKKNACHAGMRLRVGTVAHRIYLRIKTGGPQTVIQLCDSLHLVQPQVAKAANRLVPASVLTSRRLTGQGRPAVYSLGAGPVVEVSA